MSDAEHSEPFEPFEPFEPTGPTDHGARHAVIHRFTVLRGMAPVLVIESSDWYAGLVQAALARVMVDAAN
ncbi:MAG: hypothetical protein ACREJG_07260 [Candidatus Rokuibacteriota bacterium]